MRTIEDVFAAIDDQHGRVPKREILFEDGLWCIYRNPEERRLVVRRVADPHVFIVHRCDKAKHAVLDDCWYCPHCDDAVPNSIKALYTLHQWDR